MAILGGEDKQYAYTAPKPTAIAPTYSKTGTNEFGSNEMWNAMYPQLNDAIQRSTDAGLTVGGQDFYDDLGATYQTLTENAGSDPMSLLAGLMGGSGSGSGGGGAGARNAAKILLQLRAKDPYAGLRLALEKAAGGAQKTGSNAIAALKAALAQRQNPYANINFATPTAAANPLAAYMSQSGASTDQVDALRNLLQSWSADATAADQQMGSRLSTSWQNDQGSRLSDADMSAAAFQQALANNLAMQQGSLDTQYAQYQADLTRQLADLAMSSGLSLKDLGVTL